MAITIDGKTYRNLQEQVAANTDDIAYLKSTTVDRYKNEEIDEKLAEKQDTLDKVYIHRVRLILSDKSLRMNFWMKSASPTPYSNFNDLYEAFTDIYGTDTILDASGIAFPIASIIYAITSVYYENADLKAGCVDLTDASEASLGLSGSTVYDVVETIIGG